jgi:hypothetical protein
VANLVIFYDPMDPPDPLIVVTPPHIKMAQLPIAAGLEDRDVYEIARKRPGGCVAAGRSRRG